MATDLTNVAIQDGFSNLLHLDGGATSTEKILYDGDGTATVLKIGTASASVTSTPSLANHVANKTYVDTQISGLSSTYHPLGGSSSQDLVARDITVHRTLLTKDSQNVNIGDAIITLNAEETGTPTENAGIEVERGTSTNTALRWNETSDRWEFTNNGSTYYNIPISTEYNNNTYVSSDFTHDDLTGFVANEHIDWTADQGSTNIHSGNYTNTDTVDMGDGFRLVDVDSNVQVTENKYVKFKTVSGGTGFGNIASGDGSSSTPWVYELSYTDTNTTYSVVSTSADGLAPTLPASHGGKFLRGDGTWVVPPDTDTVYTHPTTAGNKHIPTGGSSGQFLGYSASGTAQWVANPNTDTVDMGDGFRLVDIDSNVAVTENEYVKIKTSNGGSHGFGAITGTGTSIDPYILTLNTPNTTYTSSSFDHDSLTNTHNLTTDIDHDALTGFEPDEHIDWTTDQGLTNIDSGNYTNTSQATEFYIRDSVPTTYTIGHGKYIKFTSSGSNSPAQPTLSGSGTDGSPYTLLTQYRTYASATTSSGGLMSSGDKTKLDGIETGATADQDLSGYLTKTSPSLTASTTMVMNGAKISANSSASSTPTTQTVGTSGQVLTSYGSGGGAYWSTLASTTTMTLWDGDTTNSGQAGAINIADKHIKFVEGSNIDINYTGSGTGAFDSPYNLTFAVTGLSYLPLAGGTMSNTTVVTNLNADLLDGVQGSNYLRSDTSDDFNGTLTIHSGGTNSYGRIKGYSNDNHFIVMRGKVTTGTSGLTITGAHRTTFVEHAENNDSTGWYFVSKQTGNYTEIARITRTGGMHLEGNKVLHAGNYSSYALPSGGGTVSGTITLSSGDIIPSADNTRRLGYDGRMWDAVWTNEINASSNGEVHLNNSGGHIRAYGDIYPDSDNTQELGRDGLMWDRVWTNEINASADDTVHYNNMGGSSRFYGTTQLYAGTGGSSPPLCFGDETGAPKKAIFMESYWMVYQGHNNEGHKFRTVDSNGAGTDDLILRNGSATLTESGTNGKQLYLKQSNADNGWKISCTMTDGYLRFFRRGEGSSPSDNQKFSLSTLGSINQTSSANTATTGSAGKFESTQSANGNGAPFCFQSSRGNHSWGIVARFATNNSGDSDRPSIQFSCAQTSTRWNVGFSSSDNNFNIVQDMGNVQNDSSSGGWGTKRLTINTSGQASFTGKISNNTTGYLNGIESGGYAFMETEATGGGVFRGYPNRNHFMSCRLNVTSSGTVNSSDAHYMCFVEHLNTDSKAFRWINSNASGYPEIMRAERVGLTVQGWIRATGDVTAYYSDPRLKDFHGKIENPLDKVMQLNGYYFTENAKAKELGYTNDRMQVGLNSEEVAKVLPEVVHDAGISRQLTSNPSGNPTGNELDYKTVKYSKIVPLLIEAIKELKNELNTLKQEMN